VILLIDTSGPACAVGIYDAAAGQLVAERSEMLGKGHAERLIAMVHEVLDSAGQTLKDMSRIAVTIGPGSFTGIRVGVAAARGFALALGVPAVGVSTLQVVAQQALELALPVPIMAAIDAGRGELFTQLFAPDGEPLSEPLLLDHDQARAALARFDATMVGSGIAALEGRPRETDAYPLLVIGHIAAGLEAETSPSPLYIRGAGAKVQSDFAVAHV
jgi:tRNA threonylcarbamoyladenosine biosynthesis protein TsaB